MTYNVRNKVTGERREVIAEPSLTKAEVLALLGIAPDSPNGPHISDYEVVVRR